MRIRSGPRQTQSVDGYIHSVETLGTVDGPGVRFVIFTQGCPHRCLYCHNPDTWRLKAGRQVASADLLDQIENAATFLKRARGGVTLSGGEPLAQPKFIASILRGCKEMGLHTALDTSGYLGSLADNELLADVDLVLLDIKAASGRLFHKLTGVEIKPTIQFAEDLAALNKPVWLRYVLVPGLTDNHNEIEALASFAASLGNIERVDVLPFHKLGEHKWRDRGLPYRLEHVQPPSEELLERSRGIFREAGLLTH